MQKVVKRLALKAILFITLCVVVNLVMNVFMPVIDTKVAVNQLNGGNEAFVALQSWLTVKRYLAYILSIIGVILFSGEIFRLIKVLKYKNDSVSTDNKESNRLN